MHTPHNIIKHIYAKTLESTLECQVSRGDPNDIIVDHWGHFTPEPRATTVKL